MEVQVVVAIVGVTAALVGSAIGGVTSYFSTRSMRRMEWRLTLQEKEISRRETLYTEFITEANRLVIHSSAEKISDGNVLTLLLALESRIWLHSEGLGPKARKICSCILDYQVKDKKGTPKFGDLRDDFIAACRKDLADARDGA